MSLPSGELSPAALVGQLRRLHLVAEERLDFDSAGMTAPQIVERLVESGDLTPWQADRVSSGAAEELVLGEYLLLAPLGEGGMGQVFHARHQLMDRHVALKVIHPKAVSNREAVERFRREIQILARLSHPNIVTAHDAKDVGDGRIALVMEYCDGPNLGQRVRQSGPLSVAAACWCVRQAAVALQHAMEHGLVHRDIKPDNLVCSGGQLKVLDFGLARLQRSDDAAGGDTITQVGVVVGTADYMAPEQALDQRRADIRSDIYALGCTAFFLLTGRAPFPGGTLQEKVLRHQVEDPPAIGSLRDGLPPELCRHVAKMMEKDPDRRFQTPAEVAAALEPFADRQGAATTAIFAENSPTAVGSHIGATDLAPSLPPVPQPVQPPVQQAVRSSPAASTRSATSRGRDLHRWVVRTLAGLLVLAAILAGYGYWRAARPSAAGPWRLLAELPRHPARVNSLAFSRDSKLLAVACGPLPEEENTRRGVYIWDVESQELTSHLGENTEPGFLHVAFSPTEDLLVASVGYWTWDTVSELHLWRPSTGQRVATIGGHPKGISGVDFSPDGKILVTVGRFGDSRLRLWDVAKLLEQGREAPQRGVDESSPALLGQVDLSEEGTMLTDVDFSPAGGRIAVATNVELVHLLQETSPNHWERASTLRCVNCPLVYQCDFSHDGKLLAAAGGKHELPYEVEPQIRLWFLDDPLREPLVLPQQSDVWSVAFSPDDRQILSGDRAGHLRSWDIATARQLADLQPHGKWTFVALAPNGRTLATGGEEDRVVKLFNYQAP